MSCVRKLSNEFATLEINKEMLQYYPVIILMKLIVCVYIYAEIILIFIKIFLSKSLLFLTVLEDIFLRFFVYLNVI